MNTRGYLRDDGLWDLEGELIDEKSYTYADRDRGPLPAGRPMHHMRVRLTVDHFFAIHAAEHGCQPIQIQPIPREDVLPGDIEEKFVAWVRENAAAQKGRAS